MEPKNRAPRNRTLTLTDADRSELLPRLLQVNGPQALTDVLDRTILGDSLSVLAHLPTAIVDLIVTDPPYNLTKVYNGTTFKERDREDYLAWQALWLHELQRILKPTGSLYICSDWRTSALVQAGTESRFITRNRITWEREKGRGALSNWKNCSEDIWFLTASDDYHFDVEAVKLKRKVLAPYRDASGKPKDWEQGEDGNFRATSPSNLWTDISVPFWSMPENTDHPTQKPEKLIAKLILASSRPGDVVLDPFLGSGTTSVVARKLGRRFIGIEQELEYALLAEKRLQNALEDTSIQGYVDGFFWERNTMAEQLARGAKPAKARQAQPQEGLFQEL
ncbi:MAG: site-specific DNA-methyltransferase [Flavobacteriales bacterium]|nr:site-specific DNA-methyltransferase [Flavobacteriales bacterium]